MALPSQGKDISEVYGLGEAGLFDEFFYFPFIEIQMVQYVLFLSCFSAFVIILFFLVCCAIYAISLELCIIPLKQEAII